MLHQQPFFDQGRQIFKLNALKCENPVTARKPSLIPFVRTIASEKMWDANVRLRLLVNPIYHVNSLRPSAAGSDQGLAIGVL